MRVQSGMARLRHCDCDICILSLPHAKLVMEIAADIRNSSSDTDQIFYTDLFYW